MVASTLVKQSQNSSVPTRGMDKNPDHTTEPPRSSPFGAAGAGLSRVRAMLAGIRWTGEGCWSHVHWTR